MFTTVISIGSNNFAFGDTSMVFSHIPLTISGPARIVWDFSNIIFASPNVQISKLIYKEKDIDGVYVSKNIFSFSPKAKNILNPYFGNTPDDIKKPFPLNQFTYAGTKFTILYNGGVTDIQFDLVLSNGITYTIYYDLYIDN